MFSHLHGVEAVGQRVQRLHDEAQLGVLLVACDSLYDSLVTAYLLVTGGERLVACFVENK